MKTLLLAILLIVAALASARAEEENATGPLEPDVLPVLEQFVDAEYPPDALKAGIEGSVILDLLINVEGSVDSVAVVGGLTPSLDAAAVEAASRFLFSPAQVGEEAVPVSLLFEYTFALDDQLKIAEQVNFSGVLKERGTRTRIAYATVVVSFPSADQDTSLSVPWEIYLARLGEFDGQILEGGSLVAMTDSLGQFEFKSLPAGPVRVTFPNTGYEVIEESESIEYGEKIEATYFLPRTSYDEYEIVVYGKTEQKEVTRQRLSITEVERIPGFGGDAIKAVQALPGVARPPFILGDIIVRGSSGEDTRFFLDGVEIPQLFHFGGVKSTYNSSALSSVDLYPGGFSSRYGGAVGGVVEITGRSPQEDRWHGVLDANLLDTAVMAEGPLNKNLSVYFTARRSYAGAVLNAALKNVKNLRMATVPTYWDFVGRLDYRLSAQDRFFLTAFSAGDAMEVVFKEEDAGSSDVKEASEALSSRTSFHRLILGHDRLLRPGMKNTFRAALGKDKNRGDFFGAFDFTFESLNYTLRDELTYSPSRKILYRAGVDAAWYPLDYAVNTGAGLNSRQSRTFSDGAGYASVEYRPIDRLLLIPGYRYDYYRELREGLSSYRLSARCQLNRSHTLTGAFGTYNQSPVPRGQAVDPVYGNPDLPATTAVHLTLGDEWQIGDLVSLKVEGYRNTQDKIPFVSDEPGVNFEPDAKARMYGLEFMLRRDQGNRFFGWVSYSLSRSERRFPRKPEPSIAGEWDANRWVVSDFDQTHHVEAVGSWNLGPTWSSGLRLRYVTGNPTTPYLGYTGNQFEYDADYGEYVPPMGAYRSSRMGPFFQVDLRVDKKFVYRNWILSAYLDVQNLNYFTYNSPEFYNYNFDYSERDVIGSIFLPTIGLRAEF